MSYDYSKKLQPIGQADSMACWFTCISWWTKAMSLESKCRALEPLEVYNKFSYMVGDGWNAGGGGLSKGLLNTIGRDSALQMTFDFITPGSFRNDEDITQPVLVIFRYPQAGGTHMNVLFNQQGSMVTAMEPYYPIGADDGSRTGKYFHRPMSFYTTGSEVGVGYLSADATADQ